MLRYCRPVVLIASEFPTLPDSPGSPFPGFPDYPSPGDPGFSVDPGFHGFPGEFIALFVLVVVIAVVVSIVRYTATRDMAKRRGASDEDASTIALFGGEVGTAAAYLRDGNQSSPVEPAPAGPSRSVEERVREVRELEAKGLITAEQATARVDEILRSV